MSEKILTVNLDSCWSKPSRVKKYVAQLKDKNIEGVFHDGGDDCSSWTLKGTKENLVKVINENWLLNGLNSPEDVMDQETMSLLGYEVSKEGKIDLM